MATFAQLCARADARLEPGRPVTLGAFCQQLMHELETDMPDTTSDPLTNGTDTDVESDTVDQPAEPFLSFDEARTAAVNALANLMARVTAPAVTNPAGPLLQAEADQLVEVALDWGQTAFVLLRAGSDEDAYLLAKAVRAIDGDIEPTAGDVKEAHRVINRIIDGARADVR